VGIIPAQFFKEGAVGLVSRSGTLTYQIGNELAQLFESDPETELIVMCGEIGGSAEEEAADFIADHVSKPVLAYIAAAAKAEALEAKGLRVGRNPTQVAEIAVEILGARV
jgi:succinyl-CoA synthetase alpha subunit